MTEDGHGADPEAGFSLVEVLVALALTSFLVIAVGGLIRLAAESRGRIEEAGKVEMALIDLRAISGALAGPKGPALARFDGSGFDLVEPHAANPQGAVMTARLSQDTGTATLVLNDLSAHETTTVDLGAFDGATLEYLDAQAPTYAWGPTTAKDQPPAGVRLRLSLAPRTWRVTLWLGAGP